MSKIETKKKTNIHTNEIKGYDKIRRFIQSLFFMPSANLKNMKNNGIIKSDRSFYDIMQSLNLYMGNKIKNSKTQESKNKKIVNDLYLCPANFFADTYMYATYTVRDMFYYITFMQMIDKLISEDGADSFLYSEFISQIDCDKKYKNIYEDKKYKADTRFNDLVKTGIIEYLGEETRGSGRDKYTDKRYRLSSDVLQYDDGNDFIHNLLDMVIFFYNSHFLPVPGYYLSKTINQYIISEYNESDNIHYVPENQLFLIRGRPIHNTLDNNILWLIFEAIKDKTIIEYSYITQMKTKEKYSMLPLKVVIEYEYGKQYCYGYDVNNNEYYTMRIDMIEDVKKTGKKYNADEKVYKNFDKDFKNRWSVANNIKEEKVKIYFNLTEDETINKQLKRRLEDTKHNGEINYIDKSHAVFETVVSNIYELIPWVNSFGEYAVVDKTVCPLLYDKIKEHNDELMVMYGII